MIFRVIWLPGAEQELAAAWLSAKDRDAVTRAAHAIDQRLEQDPETAGESRPDGRRILFASPLGAIFKVLADQGIVQVQHIWCFRKQ